MNGSATAVLTAGPGELTGGSQGVACCGGGAEIAGGGIQAVFTCAGGECAEINVEVVSCAADAGAATVGGCQAAPGGNPFARRASSLALMHPYVMQPMNMQISATNNDVGNANPNPLSAV